MNLSAGFDFSWNEASFAAIDAQGGTLFDRRLQLSGRDASALPLWMLDSLKEFDLDFSSIGDWTVGSGPGSFTGMRLAAAFVAGLAFGSGGVRKRSMPTACAMAFSLAKKEKFSKAAALFDGRKGEILAFEMLRLPDGSVRASGPGRVLQDPKADALPEDALLLALAKDQAPLERFFGPAKASQIRLLEHVEAASLALNDRENFAAKLSELVYIRPAVFVDPKAPREL